MTGVRGPPRVRTREQLYLVVEVGGLRIGEKFRGHLPSAGVIVEYGFRRARFPAVVSFLYHGSRRPSAFRGRKSTENLRQTRNQYTFPTMYVLCAAVGVFRPTCLSRRCPTPKDTTTSWSTCFLGANTS